VSEFVLQVVFCARQSKLGGFGAAEYLENTLNHVSAPCLVIPMYWLLRSLAFALLSLTACTPPPPAPLPSQTYTEAELEERLDRETPEGTLRVLVIAMQVDDTPLIQSLAGPLTKDDLELLQSTERPTLSKELQLQQGAALKIRHLQPGDMLRTADGSVHPLSPDEVNAMSLVLQIESIPTPLRVFKRDDRWQVDVTPLLTARRAERIARPK